MVMLARRILLMLVAICLLGCQDPNVPTNPDHNRNVPDHPPEHDAPPRQPMN
jgi:hypothetical protein